MSYTVLRKRKLSKWWNSGRSSERNDLERINWDVERTNVWYCRKKEEIQGMRNYLRRVLIKLCG